MIFLTLEEVIQLHDELITAYGGVYSIRDAGLLVSAIETPKATMFGEYLHATIFDKAAAYLYHIICNRAFVDGNKRTAIATMLVFLNQNGCKMKFNSIELEHLVCKIAAKQGSKEEISNFIRRHQ